MGAYSLTLCKENINSYLKCVGAVGAVERIYYKESLNCADIIINGELSQKELDFICYCIECEKPNCAVSITSNYNNY
jgi:hypothetical protein